MIVKCDWEPDSMFFLDAEIHDKKKSHVLLYKDAIPVCLRAQLSICFFSDLFFQMDFASMCEKIFKMTSHAQNIIYWSPKKNCLFVDKLLPPKE